LTLAPTLTRGQGLLGADHRPHSGGLPPRPGLHPVREDVADLPQPSVPQELLGPLDARVGPTHQALADLHRVVVPPHVSLLRRHSRTDPTPGGPAGTGVEVAPTGPVARTRVRTPSRYTGPPTARQPRNSPSGRPVPLGSRHA